MCGWTRELGSNLRALSIQHDAALVRILQRGMKSISDKGDSGKHKLFKRVSTLANIYGVTTVSSCLSAPNTLLRLTLTASYKVQILLSPFYRWKKNQGREFYKAHTVT